MKPSDFQKTVQCRFESCLKKVVRHVVKDYQKKLKRRKKEETLFCERPKNCAWWEARYGLNNGKYNPHYDVHKGADLQQFTSNGFCPGISGRVDLNRITDQGKSERWFRNSGKRN